MKTLKDIKNANKIKVHNGDVEAALRKLKQVGFEKRQALAMRDLKWLNPKHYAKMKSQNKER